jgi:hypothetical protein
MWSLDLLVSRLRFPFIRRYLSTQTPNTKSWTDLPSNLNQSNDPTIMLIFDPSQLSEMEQMYIKRFEEWRRARIIGLSFGGLVIAIYVYTIKRVRRETCLDDFTVPEPPPQKKGVEHD